MDVFYGTGNPSKLRNLQAILDGMPVRLLTPAQLGIELPDIAETGNTPLENACIKAAAYSLATGMCSFALDSGLYLQGVPPEQQPGPYVRRVEDRILTDEEFIAHYSALACQHGGRIQARFLNGLCVGPGGKDPEKCLWTFSVHGVVLDQCAAPPPADQGLPHGQPCTGP